MRLGCLRIIPAIVTLVLILSHPAHAQTVSGMITDPSGAPVSGATIAIPALQRRTAADETGSFALQRVPHGTYIIEVASLGHLTETRTVHVEPAGVTLTIVLQPSPLEMGGITVTGRPQPAAMLDSPAPSAVMQGRRLERERGQTIGHTIEHLPGVSLYSTGTGIAKPAIRGLTSQRVLVVSDGIRQEGQQWGDEHGPEIDAFSVERIEVVRGPASVLYGSDAMGGVVNVISKEPPEAAEGRPFLAGNVGANLFSNNAQRSGALTLEGATGAFGARAALSGRKSGDSRTPEGRLANSGSDELNGGGAVAWHTGQAVTSIDYAHYGAKLRIHEDPAEEPDATPFQRVFHDRVHFHGLLPFSRVRLEAHAGWQRNHRREFEEEDASEPEIELDLRTWTSEMRLHHHLSESVDGTVGVVAMRQTNESLADDKLIPDFTLEDLAAYVFEEWRRGPVTLSAGMRGESRTLNVESSSGLGIAAQNRDYSAVTASAGAVWRVYPGVAIATGVGRAWRAPTAFELFVDGVHEGTVRYEVGDPSLRPEIGLNMDAGIRLRRPRYQAEVAIFRNRIERYIFLSPTGDTDPESGLKIYHHRQADATLRGGEVSAQAQATPWLILSAGLDYVRGVNNETDNPLPLVPAPMARLGVRLTRARVGPLSAPYASTTVRATFRQLRVAEFETPTAGYALVDLGAGFEIPGRGGSVTVDVSVINFFDQAYRDHLSRYKDYALNPGRNVTLSVTIPVALAQ